jgi:RNA polymerase sigma-70 factor (ECF subfamily)
VTTRVAIDQLRSARVKREVYPGEWLPEPIIDDEAAPHAETADALSLTFLHLLEKLSPVELAVRSVLNPDKLAHLRSS